MICAKQKSLLRSPIRLFCGNSQPASARAGWANLTSDEQAAKRLHTNPGFLKTIFALLALVAIVFLLAFMGPLLSFLSIQRMLLDLQDGNYARFTSRLITYVALFVIAYFIHRVIRVKLDSLKSRRVARPITKL